MDFIASAVSHAKAKLNDPLLVVAGDFNQWRVEEALADFPDLAEHQVGNTRGDHSIDRIFSNIDVRSSGTVPPLETDNVEGGQRRSDHRVAFIQSSLDKVPSYKMLRYT